MLTHDQLAQIKAFLHHGPSPWLSDTMTTYELLQHLSDLINEVDHLQAHNKQMQTALAQLSDKEYWTSAPSVRYVESGEWPSPLDTRVHIWHGVSDPQQLAEQALIHNSEVNHG